MYHTVFLAQMQIPQRFMPLMYVCFCLAVYKFLLILVINMQRFVLCRRVQRAKRCAAHSSKHAALCVHHAACLAE